jgi:hypothetical protein
MAGLTEIVYGNQLTISEKDVPVFNGTRPRFEVSIRLTGLKFTAFLGDFPSALHSHSDSTGEVS